MWWCYWFSVSTAYILNCFSNRHDDLYWLIYLPFPGLSITNLSDLGVVIILYYLSKKYMLSVENIRNIHHYEKKSLILPRTNFISNWDNFLHEHIYFFKHIFILLYSWNHIVHIIPQSACLSNSRLYIFCHVIKHYSQR